MSKYKDVLHGFTDCQTKAHPILHGKDNVFLTGAAGTGKSYLISQFLEHKGRKQYPIVASTGAAAILVDGRTFHSFFGIGIAQGHPADVVAQAVRNKQVMKRLQEAECITIDEISMLSGQILAIANEVCKVARMCEEPWGGVRIIAVGDFAQLPPITQHGEEKDWAFLHSVWHESRFNVINLKTVVRSDEEDMLAILHEIRNGIISDGVRKFLEDRLLDPEADFDGTRLFPHRNSADNYNKAKLSKLEGAVYSFETSFDGDSQHIERMKRNLPIPDVLHLKKHALVMVRKNDTSFPYKYINGSLGMVTGIAEDTITVRLLKGDSIQLEKQLFSQLDGNGNETATAYNFPLTLAWATTIHKAQGATIDKLMVDLSRLWESGHAYVALSRVPSKEGLRIAGWSEKGIFVDEKVQEFYAGL